MKIFPIFFVLFFFISGCASTPIEEAGDAFKVINIGINATQNMPKAKAAAAVISDGDPELGKNLERAVDALGFILHNAAEDLAAEYKKE